MLIEVGFSAFLKNVVGFFSLKDLLILPIVIIASFMKVISSFI